jgi:hypothetical protein
LEEKFDGGEEVLDYFETQKAKAIFPRNRAPAEYLIELPAGKQPAVGEPSASYAGMGAATARTSGKNPKRADYTKYDETSGSKKKGEFMDVKSGGKPFKGVAKEPDKRRR